MEEETDERKQEVVFRCSNPPHPPLFDRPHPYLAITHGRHKQRLTFYNLSQGRYYTKIIPQLRGKWICNGGGNGWMYVEDYEADNGCFLNMVTMEKVKLPPLLEGASSSLGWIISSPPSDPDCRLIFYTCNSVVACKPGDESFIKLELTGIKLEAVTMFQGRIYGVLRLHLTLVVADLDQPDHFEQVQLDQDSQFNVQYRPSNLIESCGELLLVRSFSIDFTADNLRFKVFKADFNKMKWTRLKSIGNRAIFLDNFRQGWSCVDKNSKTMHMPPHIQDHPTGIPVLSEPCSTKQLQ